MRRSSGALMLAVGTAVLIVGLLVTFAGHDRTATAGVAGSTAPTASTGTKASHPRGVAASTDAVTVDPRHPEAWPLRSAAARRTHVAIFMYHLIAAAPAGTAYPELWVPPAELRAQVKALAAAGFTGVTLGEVWDAWHGDGRLPERPVVLSFDDGALSQVLAAGPILRAAGWPGVLNLATNHVAKDGIPHWGVRRLVDQGWEIDSHTVTHPDITALAPAALRHELVASRAYIEHRFRVRARFFCYPAGRNDATSRVAVQAAGYLAATTTAPGLAARSDDPFALPRQRIAPGTSGATAVALARGTAAAAPAAAGE